MISDFKLGKRIECGGHYGTIKFIGPVEGHVGMWLGVDWDDPKRGKHNGTVDNVHYFDARFPTSGSFVRTEKVNFGQNLVDSIRYRYGCNEDEQTFKRNEQQLLKFQKDINAPFLQFVGFEKVANKQRNFHSLEIVNVRLEKVSSIGEDVEINNLCPNLKELDISKNLLPSWIDVFEICSQLPRLYWINVSEYAVMHLMYGLASCNALEAEERYPNSKIPKQKTFQRLDQRLRETGRQFPVNKVVFIGESGDYIPIPAIRNQPPPVDDVNWQQPLETWDREYRRFRFNNTKVQHIEAECQDDYMKIRVGFNGSFTGLVYSAGYAYDPDCMYINGTGRDYYEFFIQLNRCGTLGKNTHNEDNRKTPTKNFMWNTVTVQYNPLIEEEFDEHFKVTCEYGYDFWKTVTFPFLDVEVATGNPVVFTLTPPECYMEIRYGYGTAGNRVTGPVRVGDPLTLIIYMRSKYDGFDIVVNDCYAHNGATKRIQLIDEYGCPVDDKLISRFRGSWSESGIYETQVFAYMKTFRFTGSPALYIECDVRMCHGRCPSQPCHWRNVKTVRKRSIDSQIKPNTSALSENVNLFQSLRVLQDGENDEERNISIAKPLEDTNNVCMRTGWFSAMLALGGAAMCILGGALLATCTKMRKIAIEKVLSNNQFNGYINHRGSIH